MATIRETIKELFPTPIPVENERTNWLVIKNGAGKTIESNWQSNAEISYLRRWKHRDATVLETKTEKEENKDTGFKRETLYIYADISA